MKQIGFTYYDSQVVVKPTTQEVLATLSGTQKLLILNGFAKKTKPDILARGIDIEHSLWIVKYLYCKIDEIEETARFLMRGEVLITPAIIDPETGEVIEEAIYNTPPSTANELLSQVQDEFDDDFTGAQVNAILTKMVEYSKRNGSGTWDFYKTEVVK